MKAVGQGIVNTCFLLETGTIETGTLISVHNVYIMLNPLGINILEACLPKASNESSEVDHTGQSLN